MCSLDVRFTVEYVFNVIVCFEKLQMTSKTHLTVKRRSKLHIQNASVIDPLGVDYTCVLDAQFECAFQRHRRFRCNFFVYDSETDI
jgi:hypothetical protein